MIREQQKTISYEKWAELTSKEIFLYEDDKPKSINRFCDMYGDDFDDEDLMDSNDKRQKR